MIRALIIIFLESLQSFLPKRYKLTPKFKKQYFISSVKQLIMPAPKVPCCVYGNPCYAVCVNPKCKQYGLICQRGFQSKQQCFLFHQNCNQVEWSQLQQKITIPNASITSQEFLQFRLKIERMFIRAIQKIKEEQDKFRIWVKTFGHSLEVMKFIKLMNDQDYDGMSGALMGPVISSFFKNESTLSKPPTIIQQQIREIQSQIQTSLENITSLYLRTVKRKTKQQYSMINIPSSPSATHIVTQQNSQTSLTRSQNNYYETRERHQSQTKLTQRSVDRYNQKQERSEGSMFSDKDLSRDGSQNNGISSPSTRIRTQMMQKFTSKIYRHVDNIKKLFTHARPLSFKLMYRASQHAFSIEQFHKLCDNVPNTLVLVETQFGKIIGGFTPLEWKSNKKQWVADKNKQTFIFSLTLMEKYELNLVQFAINCTGQKGPIFGCCDICIVDKANKEKSSAQFPISFNINKKYHRGDQASFAFTGHPKGQYRIKEWEVFKVEFQ